MTDQRTLRHLLAAALVGLIACVGPTPAQQAPQARAESEVEDDLVEPEVVVEPEHLKPEPAEPTIALRPQPPGFGAVDLYTSHDEACLAVVELEVPESKPGWRRAILDWCEHRSYHASRSGIVESKVDGSQIHDRDRPTAWRFYEHGVVDGTLDPTSCSFHAVDRELEHDQKCRALKRDWPFNSPTMTEGLGRPWMQHPHDMERFGARGPHDHNANAYRTIPGCWDPQQLERFDVSMTVTVRSSLRICECWGCATKRDIRAHWGRRSTRCPSHPGPRLGSNRPLALAPLVRLAVAVIPARFRGRLRADQFEIARVAAHADDDPSHRREEPSRA